MKQKFSLIQLATISAMLAASSASFAQATVKDDGQWRSSMGLSLSNASGNTQARSLALNADSVRATKDNKVSLYANALNGSSGGNSTANLFRLGGRYDHNFNAQLFGFGGADFEKDKIAHLNHRLTLSTGLGYHVFATPQVTWDVFGGLARTSEKYDRALTIGGVSKTSNSYSGLMLGEESSHKLSDTTSFKQRFVIYPRSGGEYRYQFDAGLGVAMSKAMNFNLGLAMRTNSEPPAGVKKTDTLLTSGISVKFD